ncbi:LamG-like jellyroll fold domain-containing protein [Thalassotalea hakodatensis]|uniref:LamG-like jellyroll fold domain-containing protein n=1 Tax=Thalassotalea hakodatensis TaxID=3030492 RepID=UPI002573A04E|nr:LamG-like jellyroll fold domain-containing protein [Thalassotalea hakodatensis]
MNKLIIVLMFSIGFNVSLSANEREGYSGTTKELPTGSKAISTNGLIAAYDFESYTSDGLLRDFSPLGNHAKLTKIHSTTGLFGKALAFSEKEDVAIIPNSSTFNLTGPITVAAKLKISTPNLHQHIFACNDLFVLWITKSNKYKLADTQGQGFTTPKNVEAVVKGKWHSVVAILSANKGDILNKENIKIFIDGVQMEGTYKKAWSPSELVAVNACVIGGTRTGEQSHQDLQFEGVIDELQIYSRAFSDNEVKAYSNGGL